MLAEKLRLEDYVEQGIDKKVLDYLLNTMSTNRSNIAFLGRKEILQEVKALEDTLYEKVLDTNKEYKWLSSGVESGGIQSYLKRDLIDIINLIGKGLLPKRFLDGLENNWPQHLKGKGVCVFFIQQDGKLICTDVYDCNTLEENQIGYIYSQKDGFTPTRKIQMSFNDLDN